MKPIAIAPAMALIVLAGCSGEAEDAADENASAQDTFFASLASHCGKAFEGRLVSEDAADADFVDADMVMHVKECSDTQIAVPFHVTGEGGEWDRSRTWLITRDGAKLRLKHDHRHEDGTSDAVTMYGGDTVEDGTERAQHFVVDPESIALFKEQDLPDSVTNVWTVEVDGADAEAPKYAYQLKRTVEGGAPSERLFRVEFDLSKEVEAPSAAWGHEG
ncbi:MAG: hypothetical protein ABJP34_04535 [Erythrobacter sp.]